MRALVTGAGGFAGRHAVERLRAAGVETFAFEGDVRDADACLAQVRAIAPRRRAPPRGDLVGRRRLARPDVVCDVNVGGTRNLLGAVAAAAPAGPLRARRRPPRSTAPCPRRTQPIGEDAPLAAAARPTRSSKLDAEAVAHASSVDDRDRAPVPAHRARPGRALRHRVVRRTRSRRSSTATLRRSCASATSRRAATSRTSAASPTPTSRCSARPTPSGDLQRLHRHGASGSATCSTRCSALASARSRSQRIPIASARRTSRCSAATPRRIADDLGGGQPAARARRSSTSSPSFARGLPDVDCWGATCADHGNHGPGRLLPRRAACSTRATRCSAMVRRSSTESFERIAPPRGPCRAPPGRPARPGVAAARRCARRGRTRSTTSRRRASCRRRGRSRC